MNNTLSSSVVIDTSLQNVSTALNGYLEIPGDVRELRDDYDINPKKEQRFKKKYDRESRYFVGCLKGIHLHLNKMDEMHTQMNYDLNIKRIGAGEIMIFVLSILFIVSALPLLIGDMYVVGLIMLLCGVLYLLIMLLLVFISKGNKRIDKLFHKIILKDLDEYCKIVAENDRNTSSNNYGNSYNAGSNNNGMNKDWL